MKVPISLALLAVGAANAQTLIESSSFGYVVDRIDQTN